MFDKRVKIGTVCVDSGTLVVCDPGYLSDLGDADGLFDWDALGDKMGSRDYAQLNFKGGGSGLGVAFSSGLGDGEYSVYAKIGNVRGWGTRVKKVEVMTIEKEYTRYLTTAFKGARPVYNVDGKRIDDDLD